MKANLFNRFFRFGAVMLLPALIGFSLLLLSGTTKGKPSDMKAQPPGTLKVADNFFMDSDEVSNFNWLEYLYWTGRVFGSDSPQYKAALPDTSQWLSEDSCLHKYATYYLRHPAYRDYPVVGVSYEQAVAYCNWRSERVFEYILIREGVIDWNKDAMADTYFTVDRYFTGHYKILKSRPDITEIPFYRLPTEVEWNAAQKHFDALRTAELSRRHPFHGKEVRKAKEQQPVVCIEVCDAGKLKTEPTAPERSKKIVRSAGHMDGNVSEWLQDKRAIGANWKDKSTHTTAMSVSKPSITVGLRCVCEWRNYTH